MLRGFCRHFTKKGLCYDGDSFVSAIKEAIPAEAERRGFPACRESRMGQGHIESFREHRNIPAMERIYLKYLRIYNYCELSLNIHYEL